MKISKYSKIKDGQIKASSIVGGGSSSSTTIEGGSSVSLDRTIWGKEDKGEDIDGTMIVCGDINIKTIESLPNEGDDDETDDGTGEYEEYEEGGGNLNVELKTTTKDLEVNNDAYIHKHLYINYPSHTDHSPSNKKCIGEIIKTVEDNIKKNVDDISTNKTNIASNVSEINSLKARMSTAETSIEINEKNIEMNEISIKNNNDEILKLKNRTTANETAIANYLPIGSIIMFSGLMSEIPDGWAICNGENGTPNLIGKFIKAWTTSGETGGSNSITLSSSNLPELKLKVDNEKINTNKEWQKRLNKYVPTLDEVGEYVFDKGGSTHYTLYTGYDEGDKGLLGVKYTAIMDDVADYLYIGEKNQTQSSIDITPTYYSLIYIMKIS